MSSPAITVAIPTIPPRAAMLQRAISTVWDQELPAAALAIAVDTEHAGAGPTRNRALDMVQTDWVAFLDDDDTLYPNHLRVLWELHQETGARLLYSWFDGNDPFPMHRGRAMDFAAPHAVPITILAQTDLARREAFLAPSPDNPCGNEDWYWMCALRERWTTPDDWAGTGEVTWTYKVHGKNTSGSGARW